MKKLITSVSVLLLVVLSVSLQSCSGKIDRTGFMPPVKIRIPNDVKKDAATVSFIKSSEKVINELSDRVENIARNGKDLLKKNEEDMSVMDKIKMTKLSVQFIAAGSSLANELEKIQQYVEKKQEDGVSETDMKAYEAVEKALEKRINQLDEKYKNLYQ